MEQEKFKKLFLSLGLVGILGCGVLLYFWLYGFLGLSGSLYLAFPNKDNYSTLYRYDIHKHSLAPLFQVENAQERIISGSVHPHKSTLVAFIKANESLEEASLETLELTDGKDSIHPVPSDVLTKETVLKKNMSWSPLGNLLAYASLTMSPKDKSSQRPWMVSVIDLFMTPKRFLEGQSPVFASENSLFLIENDGLYFTDISLNPPRDKKVWSLEKGTANSSMGLAISKDRTLLAWSNPLESKVFLFTIADGALGPELILKKTIPVLAYDPVFSPDARYLALRLILPPVSGISREPRSSFVAYNLLSLRSQVLFIAPGRFYLASMSDWQK